MIFTYKSHEPVNIMSGKVSVVATNSPIVFNDLISSINGFKNEVHLMSEQYKDLDLGKSIDFDSDLFITHELYKKYGRNIVSSVVDNFTDDTKSKVNKQIQQTFSILQEALFMTDLPIRLDYDDNVKRFLKYCRPQFDFGSVDDPYDIIINDLKIHLECGMSSVPCFNNVNNFMEMSDFQNIVSEVELLQVPILLIEFTENNNKQFYKNSQYLFIDKDFVDWKD
jgi:CRISPR type II-A-associated protein Csn2